MTDEIDNAIASLKEDVPLVTETPQKDVVPEAEKTQPEPEDKPEGDDKGGEPTEDVPFPKKAVNAISRRDKMIAKERAEKAVLLAELERYRSQTQAQKPQNPVDQNQAPKEDDFENYGDFLKAQILHDIKQEQAKTQAQAETQQKTQQRMMWEEQRTQEIAKAAEAHKAQIPDFAQVVDEYADILDSLPPEIEQVFLEADDASLAFYNLAKEGKLEALTQMSPYRAAMEIALAQTKKPQLNKVTNAPDPIRPVQGRGQSSKDWQSMTGEEMMKKLNIKY